MTALGLLETAEDEACIWVGAPAAAVGVAAGAEMVAGATVGAVAGALVGADVGAAPDGGDAAGDGLQAATRAEANGKPRPTAATRRRNTRRAICTTLCYPPIHASIGFWTDAGAGLCACVVASGTRCRAGAAVAARAVSVGARGPTRAGHAAAAARGA